MVNSNRKPSKKVLLLSLSGIGNYLMQSVAIAALKSAHPGWHITVWVAPRGTRALAENDPNVDEVIEMPIKASLTQHIRQILRLRRLRFDVAITLSPGQLLKSAAYMFLAGIPQRIGNAYPLLGSPASRFLVTDAIIEKPTAHDIEQNLALLGPLRIPSSLLPSTHYTLQITKDHQATADAILQKAGIPSDRTLVGIHAGSAPDLAFKRWPAERFAEVAAELIQRHTAHILLFGGPDEEDQKQQLRDLILSSLPPTTSSLLPISLISSSLLTTAAIMQKCRLILANDSGLMHLAAAAGVPVIGIFGPTNEALTGPRGRDSAVIRAPGKQPVYQTENGNTFGNMPHASLLAITPAMVLARLRQKLQI